ncbi:MAG: hypothetical protein EOP24_37325 [Hyphomicrobiales bacterium]|nr:MAG: hypothetical protein EOP24_37325 [Hyphomicrobiales bacterium]
MHWTIGEVRVTKVQERVISLPPEVLYPGADPSALRGTNTGTAAVARFHADRAAALLDDNLEQTIIGLRDISAYLVDHNGGGPDLNDRVR